MADVSMPSLPILLNTASQCPASSSTAIISLDGYGAGPVDR